MTETAAPLHAFEARWQSLSLANRFAVAGGLVLATASVVIGAWLAHRIEDSVVRNTANTTALYMDSFVSPISQQLADGDELSIGARRALEEIFANTPLGQSVVSYKIWKEGGLIVEASDRDLIGRRFEPGDGLLSAWAGEVSAEFEELGDAENAAEGAMDLPLLEIYSPIREDWSGEIIAVAEFYVEHSRLADDLHAATRASWLTVAGSGLILGSLLYAIVLGGSRTIDRQNRALDARLAELRDLSAHNHQLRLRVQNAAGRAAANTETALRRIGADLHDGPAQYLAFAALRLDAVRDQLPPDDRGEVDSIRDALDKGLTEVRAISRGLSLPEVSDRPLCQIVHTATDAHHARTGTPVAVICDCDAEPQIGPAVRICVFRFVQEGLNNATRHADGADVAVTLSCRNDIIFAAVSDGGPGLPATDLDSGSGRLGLSGLRDRVESLGGKFQARNLPDGGAEIRMTLETGG